LILVPLNPFKYLSLVDQNNKPDQSDHNRGRLSVLGDARFLLCPDLVASAQVLPQLCPNSIRIVRSGQFYPTKIIFFRLGTTFPASQLLRHGTCQYMIRLTRKHPVTKFSVGWTSKNNIIIIML